MNPIRCPKCGTEITLDAAISQQMSAELERKMSERLAAERARIEADAKQKAASAAEVELADLRNAVAEKADALATAQKKELELRQQQRALEDAKQSMEVDLARRLDEERQKVREEALKKADEEHRLKDMEKDGKLADLMAKLAEAQRRAEQGSQQTQGEVQELDLEERLRDAFPFDRIEPVPKGKKGADVVHRVCDRQGRVCGTIVWESKRTKSWGPDWIDKLKEDQREAKGDIAVLMTTVLPKGIETFGLHEGVWVTSSAYAIGLGTALRDGLLRLGAERVASAGREGKKEQLYDYLSGPDFQRRIVATVEAFKAMRQDIQDEKAAMERLWTKREMRVDRVIRNTICMCTEIEAISGTTVPELEKFELKAIAGPTPEGGGGDKAARPRKSLPAGDAGRDEEKSVETDDEDRR